MSPLALSLRFLQAQPDGRLVELARQGHEAAFEALVRRYRSELLCYCRRLATDVASAEDALQQALLQAWKALKAGAGVRDVRPWLYRIAHNVAISHLRAAGAAPQEIEDAPASFDVDQIVQQRLRARAALAGMASLPELQRQVFVSTTLDGASHDDVATALGLTDGSVRGLIYRARAALRAAAAAVIPSPLLSWAIRRGGMRSKRTHAVVEAVVGGGGAGVAGLIAKGGAVIALTGAIAGGGMIVSPTTPHRPSSELHRAGGSSIPATLVARRTQGAAPRTRGSNASASVPGAHGSSDSRSGRDGSSGPTGGSAGASASGGDGSSSGGSDGGSRAGSTGSSSGGSDRGSSSATTAQSSGSTPGGGSGDSRRLSGSSSSDGGSSGSSGSSGGTSGTSGGQVTTVSTTSSGTSGPDGGSSGSSGSGDTTTTTGTP